MKQPITIELTDKSIKTKAVFGRVAIIIGLLILFAGFGDHLATCLGLALTLLGAGTVITANVLRWWHHS